MEERREINISYKHQRFLNNPSRKYLHFDSAGCDDKQRLARIFRGARSKFINNKKFVRRRRREDGGEEAEGKRGKGGC